MNINFVAEHFSRIGESYAEVLVFLHHTDTFDNMAEVLDYDLLELLLLPSCGYMKVCDCFSLSKNCLIHHLYEICCRNTKTNYS